MPVGYSPVGEKACKTLAAVIDQGVSSSNIQICFLLSCKGGVRQVLGRGRRTYRHIHIRSVLLFHLGVGLKNSLTQVIGKLSGADNVSCLLPSLLEIFHIMRIKPGQGCLDITLHTRGFKQMPVCMGCYGKTIRHSHPF